MINMVGSVVASVIVCLRDFSQVLVETSSTIFMKLEFNTSWPWCIGLDCEGKNVSVESTC